jgi:NNP family nitrate/nitrite transporter-like MFS transporter
MTLHVNRCVRSRSRALSLFLLVAVFFMNYAGRILFAPFLPLIEKDLDITHAEAGALLLAISAGYSVMLLGSSAMSARLTHRGVILLSALGAGGALMFVSVARSPASLGCALFALGGAAGMYLPSGVATIAGLVDENELGRGFAAHEVAPGLAAIFIPLMAGSALRWLDWRQVVGPVGGVTIVVGLAFYSWGGGGRFTGQALRLGALRDVLGAPSYWAMVAFFALSIGLNNGLYNLVPLFLVTERSLALGAANLLVSCSRIAALAVTLLAGWLSDTFGPRKLIAGVFLVTGLFTVWMGVGGRFWSVIPIVLQPSLGPGFVPAGFSLLVGTVPSRDSNLAVSTTMPLAYLVGAGLIPLAITWLGDRSSLGLGIVLLGGLTLTSVPLLRFVRFPSRKLGES